MKNAILWDVMPCDTCKSISFGGTSVLIKVTHCNIPADDNIPISVLISYISLRHSLIMAIYILSTK
jgi:hypothetical protein